jgi:hypothetical protein
LRVLTYFAYLDPGTGSVVIQSIIGIVAGVGVFGRKALANAGHKIKGVLSRSEETGKSTDE